MRICDVEGCGLRHNSHGFCQKHALRFLRYGDPLGTFQRPERPAECTVEGCSKPNERAGNLCQMHRWRLDHYGDVNHRRYADGCSVDGCDRPHSKNGYCGMHHQRVQRTGTTADPVVILDAKRYRVRQYPGHPLAFANGRAYVHRVVLYDAIGPGTHSCNWCGTPVRWEATYPAESDALIVDHLDHDRHNCERENLVPSCNSCNSRRRRAGQVPTTEPSVSQTNSLTGACL